MGLYFGMLVHIDSRMSGWDGKWSKTKQNSQRQPFFTKKFTSLSFNWPLFKQAGRINYVLIVLQTLPNPFSETLWKEIKRYLDVPTMRMYVYEAQVNAHFPGQNQIFENRAFPPTECFHNCSLSPSSTHSRKARSKVARDSERFTFHELRFLTKGKKELRGRRRERKNHAKRISMDRAKDEMGAISLIYSLIDRTTECVNGWRSTFLPFSFKSPRTRVLLYSILNL